MREMLDLGDHSAQRVEFILLKERVKAIKDACVKISLYSKFSGVVYNIIGHCNYIY